MKKIKFISFPPLPVLVSERDRQQTETCIMQL